MRRRPRTGEAVVAQDGVKLFLPAESRLLLDGVTIDFVDTPAKTGFVFIDPKKASCGCSSAEAPSVPEHALSGARIAHVGHDDFGAMPAGGPDFDAVAASILGAGLPADADAHLRAAGAAYHRDAEAESHLMAALRIAPDHPAVLIGLYRFYFYKGRLVEALGVARQCLANATRQLGVGGDWRCVEVGDAEFGSYAAVLPRFFMFTLKGYAYLQMRLGNWTRDRRLYASCWRWTPPTRSMRDC